MERGDARDEQVLLAAEDRTGDLDDLLGGFPGAEDHFGEAFAERPLKIDLCEGEFGDRRGLERAQYSIRIHRTSSKFFEEFPPVLRRHGDDSAKAGEANNEIRCIGAEQGNCETGAMLNGQACRGITLNAGIMSLLCIFLVACQSPDAKQMDAFKNYQLDYDSKLSPELQRQVVAIDAAARARLNMRTEDAALGVLDLKSLRLAMIHPDRGEYAASVPKIGILLAYFELRPEATTNLPDEVRHDLGLMVKASSNEAAAKFSRELGLKEIRRVLEKYGFYHAQRGGGIWVGKHYGVSGERYGDPVGDNSHAATVRQVLRYYLMLEQGGLVSPEASKTMREIFESPEVPHDNIKFVKALASERDEGMEIIRKWGSWENWLHDSAVVKDERRHYIIVGLTHHPRGDEYLEAVAREVHGLF